MPISHLVTHFRLPVFYLGHSAFSPTKINSPHEMCRRNNRRNFCLPAALFARPANRIGEPHRLGRRWSNARVFSVCFCISGWRTDREVFRERDGVSKCYMARYCILNAFRDTYNAKRSEGLDLNRLEMSSSLRSKQVRRNR